MKPFKFFQKNRLPITNLVIAVVSQSHREFIIFRNFTNPEFDVESRDSNRFIYLGIEYVFVGGMRDVIGRKFNDYIIFNYFHNISEILQMVNSRLIN